jgi:hypothetical protein
MSSRHTLLVLANSCKQGGRCLAGRFVRSRNGKTQIEEWCRPVLPIDGGNDAIPTQACERIKPLDIVSIDLHEPRPIPGQAENWLWERDTAIAIEGTLNSIPNSLGTIIERPANLWLDSDASHSSGISSENQTEQSLVLIQPRDLLLTLQAGERRRTLASFEYAEHKYENIAVTDPVMFRILARQFPATGSVSIGLRNGDSYWLTLSLGLPFGARQLRYMFVAAVIDHSGYLQRTYR